MSKVYFIKVTESDDIAHIASKLSRLLQQSRLFDFLKNGEQVAVKIHFGEEGNTGYVRPEYVRTVVADMAKKAVRPFLSDTNTLYRGRRTESQEHLALAVEHGFTRESVGCPVVVPDDTQKENVAEVTINQRFIKTALIARIFQSADSLVCLNHFKGHLMTGFGGALKNLGMGCAARKGKLSQHSDIAPVIYQEKCVGCEACVAVCPVTAITMINNKANLDGKKCIGCASCIAACRYHAIDVSWESGGSTMAEKMIEYASAVLKNKKDKCACINFAIKITQECDCLAKDDPRIAPDIGILASCDPVSVDKAAYDLVLKACGKDIFKEVHPQRDAMKQVRYAAQLGLGSLEYELIEIA